MGCLCLTQRETPDLWELLVKAWTGQTPTPPKVAPLSSVYAEATEASRGFRRWWFGSSVLSGLFLVNDSVRNI